MDQILRALGVTADALAPSERAALDRDGYVVLRDVALGQRLEDLRAAFEAATAHAAPASDPRQTGTRHVADLSGTSDVFDSVYAEPRVLAVVSHVLRVPFQVFHLSGRDPLPGFGQQGLHADWYSQGAGAPWVVVTVLWLLDEYTARNGATRVVPGSHLFRRMVPKALADPAARHGEEATIVAPAGSVLAFNGHLWHSGTRNDTASSRRVIQCQYIRGDHARAVFTKVAIPDRVTGARRALLGG
ncbi:MAG: phytanoyl-CoA dioxygenase family protein [Acidobacteriota bacterium]